MSGDYKEPLLSGNKEPLLSGNYRSENPYPLYVLVFPNVFEPDSSPSPSQSISVASNHLLKILNQLSDAETTSLLPAEKNAEKIAGKLFPNKTDISQAEMNKGLVTAVVFVIRNHCKLEAELYRSRGKDMVFCLITAEKEKENETEKVLKQRAADIEYRLQLKSGEAVTYLDGSPPPYTQVSPYIELVPGSSESERLKTYNSSTGEEDSHGSIFTFPDKTRLAFSLLSEAININYLIEIGLLKTHYCVHNTLHLNQLQPRWASLKRILTPQPIDSVRNYFGEKIAMYFAWLGFYCWCMVFTAIVGTVAFLVEKVWGEMHGTVAIAFALYLSFWAAFFDQFWIRREKKMAWKWGTIGYSEIEEQRQEFKGEIAPDPVTRRLKKQRDSSWKLFRQAVSYSLVGVCIMMVIIAVLGIFIFRATLVSDYRDSPEEASRASLYCAMLNFVQIKIMNIVYTIIARKMTDWENHETESEYVDSFSVKLALFRFVNCYISLFYIAFLKANHEGCINKDCEGELAMQLGTIFLMNLGMNLVELGWPYLSFNIRKRIEDRAIRRREREQSEEFDRIEMTPTEEQSKLDAYETPMEDYMEMVCQYGYVVMFSSAFPIVGVLALLEILVEIRVDGWKLCMLTRRPFPHRCESIGIWFAIIQMVSYMGIVTNTALIMFGDHPLSLIPESQLANFLLVEHALLALKFLVSLLVPDEPQLVRQGLMWSNRVSSEQIFTKKLGYFSEVKMHFAREIQLKAIRNFELKLKERGAEAS